MSSTYRRIGYAVVFTLGFVVVNATAVFAVRDQTEYFTRPQVGAWFGPITPVGPTADLVDTDLGGGIFLRYNTPLSLFKLGLDSSYQHFASKGVNEITLVPVYANVLFLLPLDFPLRFQLKTGFGGAYVYVMPDDVGQWDMMLMWGFEVSFPAGRFINIGLRIDYILVLESYRSEATDDGHFINAGIMLYFNI